MQFTDFSPSPSPTLDQQRDALQKGLGRAMLWAMGRRLDEDQLLEACLRDLRYDTQCESSRGDWLWRLIRANGCVDRFRVPILHALYQLSDEQSANQLCELARHYAETGDETFRARLYEIVEQRPFADRPWLGEDEIIDLEGEKGFLFAARIRGKQLVSREWEWDDDELIIHAIERSTERRVNHLLENASDPAIEVYREGWLKQKLKSPGREQGPSHADAMRAMTVTEILSEAESNNSRTIQFRSWGIYAQEAALSSVVQNLWASEKPRVIANLLKVFWKRDIPQFDDRLIELCQHSDAEVRRWACNASERLRHPRIRDFAISELESGLREPNVVRLFTRNYEKGDEQRLLDAIELPNDPDVIHGLVADVIKILENNPEADYSQLGIICYASTPCEVCRHHAVRLFHGERVAPAWLTEEWRFDSRREIVDEMTRPTNTITA